MLGTCLGEAGLLVLGTPGLVKVHVTQNTQGPEVPTLPAELIPLTQTSCYQ